LDLESFEQHGELSGWTLKPYRHVSFKLKATGATSLEH
jgi:hypothetical protein